MAPRRSPLRIVLLAALACLVTAGVARAAPVRVGGRADAGLPYRQAQAQARNRAFIDAVMREALRLVPKPPSAARQNALRRRLAPRAVNFVQSYRIVPALETGEADERDSTAARSTVGDSAPELTLDVEIDDDALQRELVDRGFFVEEAEGLRFGVSFGPGVTERSFGSLAGTSVLLGVTRAEHAVVTARLERLPQGSYRAVLRRAAGSWAAEADSLSDAWLAVWARYFRSLENASSGIAELAAHGFTGVDGVREFTRALSAWNDAVRDALPELVDLAGNDIAARWSVHVLNRRRLEAHLRRYVSGRGLTVTGNPARPTTNERIP